MKKIVLKATAGSDITETLQSLVDENEGKGNVIIIPKGRFEISKTIVLKSETRISGSSKQKTKLVLKDDTNDNMFTNADHKKGNSSIGVYNLVLDGNSKNQNKPAFEKRLSYCNFFYFKKGLDVELHNIHAIDCKQTAMHFNSCVGVSIKGLKAKGMGWSGVSTSGTDDIVVMDTSIIDSGKDIMHSAVHLDGGHGSYVQCYVENCTGNGIMLDSKYSPLSKSVVQCEGKLCLRGISLSGAHENALSGILIKKSKFSRCETGIRVSNSRHVFIDRTFIRGSKIGIQLQGKLGGKDVVVCSCRFKRNKENIQEIHQSSDNYFIENDIEVRSNYASKKTEEVVKEMTPEDKYSGKCVVCGVDSIFSYFGGSVRESYRCTNCDASLRHRSQAQVIIDIYGKGVQTIEQLSSQPSFKKLHIFEPGIIGPLRKYFTKFKNYLQSYYWTDIPFGKSKKGIRNEDLQQLTLDSDTWDLIITADIFEHIRKPYLAHKEIHRVLKKGGRHIFTIPIQHPMPKKTAYRVDTSTDVDKHILPERYHIAGDGGKSLVYTDFGADMLEELDTIGFETEVVQSDKDHKLRGKNITFVCTKK